MRKWNSFLKRCSIMLSAALFLTFTPLFADIDSDLLVHYTFDDGTAKDQSGNNNDGTLFGGAVVSPDGHSGGALYLGTEAKPAADYLKLPDGITSNLENFTIATWVKLDNFIAWQRIFDLGGGPTDNMFMAVTRGNNTAMRFAIKANNSAEQTIDGRVLETGTWIHVAIVADYTRSTGRLFVNGELAGTNTGLTRMPKDMLITNQNYIGKAQYEDQGYNGYVDDFRIYKRALTDEDILVLNGLDPVEINAHRELNSAFEQLEEMNEIILGNNESFLDVWDDLNLMTQVAPTNSTLLTWTSSNESVIATNGQLTFPKATTSVKLTVTLSHPDITATKTKEYKAIVFPEDPLPYEIAFFTFEDVVYQDGKMTVSSKGSNPIKYTGTYENGAKKRTIGIGTTYTVLDLGNDKGYLDMGKEIGKAIYNLTDYTMSGYYLVEEDAENVTGGGNFLWSFSNSDQSEYDKNGYIFSRPWESKNAISQTNFATEARVAKANYFTEDAFKGKWHHILYSQVGTKGTLYVDGDSVTSATINLFPVDLRLEGREGTDFNFLGRPCYSGDQYINKTLVHDFRIYGLGFSKNDVEGMNIAQELANLNAAYQDNDGRSNTNPSLSAAYDALTFTLPAILENDVIFPAGMPEYSDINITWTTSNELVLTGEGTVIRQKYYDYPIDSITAQLMDTQTGDVLNKVFHTSSSVPKLEGSDLPAGDLLVHYDFSQVNGSTVTDQAGLGLEGTLMNEAEVVNFATEEGERTTALSLGNGTGYFDMGQEIGQLLYNTNDYTLGAYVYIDEEYEDLEKNGNFLWTFANEMGNSRGYMISILGGMRIELRGDAAQNIYAYLHEDNSNWRQPAQQGSWFHFAYTQEDDLGTIYVNGEPTNNAIVSNIPSVALPVAGKLGTTYNWLGKSNYEGDNYLRQTFVSDFRFYRVALDESDFESKLDVTATLEKLNRSESTSMATLPQEAPYKVYAKAGQVMIEGLTGNENISLFDIMGHRYDFKENRATGLNAGIYIVRINNFVTKIVVK